MEQIKGISYEVQYVFTLATLVYVMPELRHRGIDTVKIMRECWQEYDESNRKDSQPVFFLKYGVRVINPMLNKILKRPTDHPSFNEILEASLADVIAKDSSLNKRTRKKT